jgi:hypothetical protein
MHAGSREKAGKVRTLLAAIRLPGASTPISGEQSRAIPAASTSPAPARDAMPDLRNATLRDAILHLQRLGVEVEYTGEGLVKEQTPAPGAPLRRGDRARLQLGWAG